MKTIAQLLITLKIEGVKAIISIRSYPIFCCKNVQYFICLPCIFLKRFLSFIKRCDAKMTNCHSHISNPLNPIILNSRCLASCMGNWRSQHSRSSLFSAAKSMDCSERIRISHLCRSQSCLVYWGGTKQENLTESALRER